MKTNSPIQRNLESTKLSNRQKLFHGETDIGLKRKNNEDTFIVSPALEFCLAADGIGGAAAGELASKIFAETALEIFYKIPKRSEKEIIDQVQKVFSFANDKILDHVIQNPNHKGMGCTAELLAFFNDDFVVGHVGDSRTYRLRNGKLRQLTQDHTLVQQQLQEGLISLTNAKIHPLRNIILRAVGIDRESKIDLLMGKALPDDLFLLCTDGLTDMVQDDQIQDVLSAENNIDVKVKLLIDSAISAGGDDNVTVVLAAIS